MRQHRLYLFLSVVVLLIATLMMALVMPINAQNSLFATNTPGGENQGNSSDNGAPLIFATNTPEGENQGNSSDNGAPLIFATNTPAGSMPDSSTETGGLSAPGDILFNYGMRFWLEEDFVDLVLSQVEQLEEGDDTAQLAINILLYEMERRFPSSPTNPGQRAQLINAMISAPAGSLDMRSILHPFIQDTIDSNPDEFVIEANGFQIALSPANLDGNGEFDRVVNVRYEQDGMVYYDEYLLAVANDSGSYTILPASYELPAVPYGGVRGVSMEYLRDVNADTLDELVLRVDDGMASDRFFIIEYRNGRAVDLIDPVNQMRIGNVINWSLDTESSTPPPLTVFEYQTISAYPDWQCLSQVEVTWTYERNLYRRSQDMNAHYTNIDSLGCSLAEADLFTLPVPGAITTIESAILEYGLDAPSANRALMTLSMLYVMSGRLEDARNTAQSIITVDDDSSWESRQANALIRASNASGNTALDICEALALAGEYPACDMTAVIGRFLDILTLTTDTDLIEQLESAGLSVLEDVSISEIGRVERIVVSFQYFDSGWWGFYNLGNGVYSHEEAEAPAGFEEASFPLGQIQAPQTAINALLIDNDPRRTLTILDNAISANPGRPLAPVALYMQALSYELTGDRDTARAIYYDIWERYGSSITGEIAAPHLELR